MFSEHDAEFDRQHIWHPYTSMRDPLPCYPVVAARGVHLQLADGRELVDGMSSWWAAIHGYNHPRLNQALQQQMAQMSHVMFGGITHPAAVAVCRQLVDMTPEALECVFLADSGSVAVEVAMKMAMQFWLGRGEVRQQFLTLQRGYHGDTFAAMSVCDPDNSMHSLWRGYLPQHHFAAAPQCAFDDSWDPQDADDFVRLIEQHHAQLAAVILEPVVQGAGGMRFYHPRYLQQVKACCERYGVLLIADEIATGFGRTGKLFACEHAGVVPDILCVGKALTGGMMTLAATLTSREVAGGISDSPAGCFMHGPTFMANPLACAVASESLNLLSTGHWQQQVAQIEQQLRDELLPLRSAPQVADVRVLGAIGVVETHQRVNMAALQHFFVERGVWIRPFGRLIYLMPPYVITPPALRQLTQALAEALSVPAHFLN